MGSFSSSPSNSGGTPVPPGPSPSPSNPDSSHKHLIPYSATNECYTFHNANTGVADNTVFNAVDAYLKTTYKGTVEDSKCPTE